MWWKKIFKPQERLPGDEDMTGNLVNLQSYAVYNQIQSSNTKRKGDIAFGVQDTEEV